MRRGDEQDKFYFVEGGMELTTRERVDSKNKRHSMRGLDQGVAIKTDKTSCHAAL